ncbi:SUMF1/EgtB/PvdO family nonheme iron enzyme [Sphingobacterium bovistauri]|uniref:SUMF1/EgtB/PvdO family nonheme iron enzyme n=1 Tax=Sphingobacterium bovistauri TaxID=2781959 RepID=A0ABS7Z3L3_9SPHI|nr:SUMF1/EgtB/PvdO family nonheme iron enzyme [Sphingobacterium bovistauri]MCA5004763.1 SUMF1/EgtB/PvdO family nonheme iron enzyme [Sphingobacterium bovistauri]
MKMNVLKRNGYMILSMYLAIILFNSCAKQDTANYGITDTPVHLKLNSNSLSPVSSTVPNYTFSYGVFMISSNDLNLANGIESNRQYNFDVQTSISTLVGNPIYYPQSTPVNLIAYAPYKAGLSNIYPLDISNQSDLKAIDLLYSNGIKNINKQESPVSISFDHQLSKIVFSLYNFDNTTAGLENVNIALKGFPSQAEFDLANGTISNPIISTNPIAIGLGREAIVIPNSTLTNRVFSFELDGFFYEYTLPNLDAFEKGKVYNYLITINNKKITVSLSNITPWVKNSSGIDDSGIISADPIEYAYIPAGIFQMGAPDTSTTSITDKPQHWVKISKSFYMSKYEITVAQYAEFLNAISVTSEGNGNIYHNFNGKSIYLFYSLDESTPYFENNKWRVKLGRENYPMQGVTWRGALAYAQWKGATLPTEAQWEYAYRATTKNKFFTGNFASEMMAYGHYYNNTGGFVQPVGQKLSNPWGLYDIAGNVLEWCLDGPSNNSISSYVSYSDEFNPLIDPVGIIDDTGNAYYRGGNYSAPVQTASAYYRNSVSRSYSAWQIGFRIVLNP